MNDLTVFNISKDLLECIHNALEDAGLPLPCRECAVPGDIAWDDCQGGQLVVSTTREFQSRSFPQEELEGGLNSSCNLPYLVVEMVFSLTRCAPTPKGMSTTVPCAELEDTSQLLHRDAYWMRNALSCCLRDMKVNYVITDVLEYVVGSTTRVGPEGGCVGNEIIVLLGFRNA